MQNVGNNWHLRVKLVFRRKWKKRCKAYASHVTVSYIFIIILTDLFKPFQDCVVPSTENTSGSNTSSGTKKQTLHEMIASVPDFSLKVHACDIFMKILLITMQLIESVKNIYVTNCASPL